MKARTPFACFTYTQRRTSAGKMVPATWKKLCIEFKTVTASKEKESNQMSGTSTTENLYRQIKIYEKGYILFAH